MWPLIFILLIAVTGDILVIRWAAKSAYLPLPHPLQLIGRTGILLTSWIIFSGGIRISMIFDGLPPLSLSLIIASAGMSVWVYSRGCLHLGRIEMQQQSNLTS